MFDRRSRPHHHSSWLYGRPPRGSPSVSHGRRCPRSDVPFPTSPSDISAVAAPATRWVPLSSHPLPRFDKRSSSSVRALPSGRVLLHAHQQYRLTRSDSLTPTLPFPTHGYRTVSYTHLRAHETRHDLVCRLLLEKKKKKSKRSNIRK